MPRKVKRSKCSPSAQPPSPDERTATGSLPGSAPSPGLPDYAEGTVEVMVDDSDITTSAHLYFCTTTDETCITSAALPPGTRLIPRAAAPNLPVCPCGVSAFDFECLGSAATYDHYALIDLSVFPCTAFAATLVATVPVRVLHSSFPAVLLGTNDFANWKHDSESHPIAFRSRQPPAPEAAHSVGTVCAYLIKSCLSDRPALMSQIARSILNLAPVNDTWDLVLAVQVAIKCDSWQRAIKLFSSLPLTNALSLRADLSRISSTTSVKPPPASSARPSDTTSSRPRHACHSSSPPAPGSLPKPAFSAAPAPVPPLSVSYPVDPPASKATTAATESTSSTDATPLARDPVSAAEPSTTKCASGSSTCPYSSTCQSDLETAAWCAATSVPRPGESFEEAHVRINACFAGHHQLEHLRLRSLLEDEAHTSRIISQYDTNYCCQSSSAATSSANLPPIEATSWQLPEAVDVEPHALSTDSHIPADSWLLPEATAASPDEPITFCFVTTVTGDGTGPQGIASNSSTDSSDSSPSASPAAPPLSQPAVSGRLPSSPSAQPNVLPPASTPTEPARPVDHGPASPTPVVLAPPLPPPLPSSSASTSPAEPVPSANLAGHSQYPYYAVARGIVPNVYKTWSECWANTCGVSDNMYKGFVDYDKAVAFVNEFRRVLTRSKPLRPPAEVLKPSLTHHGHQPQHFDCSAQIIYLIEARRTLPSVIYLTIRSVPSISAKLRGRIIRAIGTGIDGVWSPLHALCATLSPASATTLGKYLLLLAETPASKSKRRNKGVTLSYIIFA